MVSGVLIKRYAAHFRSETWARRQAYGIFTKVSKDKEKTALWQLVSHRLLPISLYSSIQRLMGMLSIILDKRLGTIRECFSDFSYFEFGLQTIDEEILEEKFGEVHRHLPEDPSMAEQGFIARDGCQDEGLKRGFVEAFKRARKIYLDKSKEIKEKGHGG